MAVILSGGPLRLPPFPTCNFIEAELLVQGWMLGFCLVRDPCFGCCSRFSGLLGLVEGELDHEGLVFDLVLAEELQFLDLGHSFLSVFEC